MRQKYGKEYFICCYKKQICFNKIFSVRAIKQNPWCILLIFLANFLTCLTFLQIDHRPGRIYFQIFLFCFHFYPVYFGKSKIPCQKSNSLTGNFRFYKRYLIILINQKPKILIISMFFRKCNVTNLSVLRTIGTKSRFDILFNR